jgi:hypothetical protein
MPLSAAPAPEQAQLARALHTLTHVAQRCVVVGGQSALGAVGSVGVLAAPAVLHWQRLARELQHAQQRLAELRHSNAGLGGQVAALQAALRHSQVEAQVRGVCYGLLKSPAPPCVPQPPDSHTQLHAGEH